MHAPDFTTVQDPGPARIPSRLRIALLVALVVGVAVFAAAVALQPQRAWLSFLQNFFFFLVLGLAGTFLAALESVVSATWSVPFRRIAEALSSYVPVALVLGVVLLLGAHHIYPWLKAGFHFRTATKQAYFGFGFYSLRTIFFLSGWTLFTFILVRMSLRQDKDPQPMQPRPTFGRISTKRGRISAGFLIFFAYTFTLASVDWVMSLQPHWETTMWGVYIFAGLFQCGLAMVMLISVLLYKNGQYGEALRPHHYVDLSRMMHAFSIFMVYIGFAQYMLIWYANYPEESRYIHLRENGGWGWIFLILLFLKWVLPFTILLNQRVRTNPKFLIPIASLIIFAEYCDTYWLVMPAFHPAFYVPGWIEIGIFAGFLGIFGLVVTRFLSKHSIVPIGDPRLANSVAGRYL